jgi:fatty acid desaturase
MVVPQSQLVSRSEYVHALKAQLPSHAFERATSRVAFLPVHLAVIVVATLAIARGWIPWFTVPFVSLVIGASFAGMTFVAHEALHGGLVKNKQLQYVIGWLGFLPFMVSPRLWIAWHNVDHHANANLPADPDAYPTLTEYHERRGARFAVDAFSLGGRRWRGALSLVLGFTVQSAGILINARQLGIATPEQRRKAFAESLLGLAVWATVAALVGFVPFLFVFGIPLLLANACVMAFILTNHSLSPRVAINDPLASGLTVTVPRIVEWLTLGFGYHVEHHLFPAMSTRHAPAVRALVQSRWPERYQSMSLTEALGRLHRSARVYKTARTLFDPKTGLEHATL